MVVMAATPDLGLHPDRLLPSEPGLRTAARQLYDSVKDLPIISPHGHVPAHWLAEDTPFRDPTSLLITPDHYVNRMLHAHGVELSALGVGQDALTEEASRAATAQQAAKAGDLPVAVPAVLNALEPGLGNDNDLVDAVLRQADAIQSQ
jgi:glucuronate isomerase